MLPELDGWIPIASVLVVYGLAELASAYGLLAAFVAWSVAVMGVVRGSPPVYTARCRPDMRWLR